MTEIADASVDVIISNCVVNLSPNKPKVFEECFRILKEGLHSLLYLPLTSIRR